MSQGGRVFSPTLFALAVFFGFILVLVVADLFTPVFNYANNALNATYRNMTKTFSQTAPSSLMSDVNTLASFWNYIIDVALVLLVAGTIVGASRIRKV